MEKKNLQSFDEIKQRLLYYAERKGIAMGDFYEKISMYPSNFAGKGGESSLKSDNIVKVLNTFPDLNPDWLLLGNGEMLRSEVEKKDIINPLEMVSLKKYEEKVEECALLKAELKVLKEQAARYAETKGAYSGITTSMEI